MGASQVSQNINRGNGKPVIDLEPVPPSSFLFNALMRHYNNDTRAYPLKSLSATMLEACEKAGCLEQARKDFEEVQPKKDLIVKP